MKKLTILLFIALLQPFVTYATEKGDSTKCRFSCCRPDAVAPAGIMTDHVHEKGKFSIAYTYMQMAMNGNQTGTKNVSNPTIFNTYLMATTRMKMQMHMLMPMYGVTVRLTVMAMLNYNVNSMNMSALPTLSAAELPACCKPTGASPNVSKSSGFGDTKIYALYNMLPACNHRLVAGLGVSLPTGSTYAKGATVQSNYDVLPYCMQLGTGTYNLLPSLVYVGQGTHLSWGAALNTNIKLGTNTNNYSVGNEYSVSLWLAYQLTNWISVSTRAEYYMQAKLYGYDATINQSSLNDATANTTNYGGQKVNAYLGLNLYAPTYFLKRGRLLLEYGMPVYQNVYGLQSTVRSTVTARLQFNF